MHKKQATTVSLSPRDEPAFATEPHRWGRRWTVWCPPGEVEGEERREGAGQRSDAGGGWGGRRVYLLETCHEAWPCTRSITNTVWPPGCCEHLAIVISRAIGPG